LQQAPQYGVFGAAMLGPSKLGPASLGAAIFGALSFGPSSSGALIFGLQQAPHPIPQPAQEKHAIFPQQPTFGTSGPSNFGPFKSSFGAFIVGALSLGTFGLQQAPHPIPQPAQDKHPIFPQQPTFGTSGPSNFGPFKSSFGAFIVGALSLGA
jgi:hypothetical protein